MLWVPITGPLQLGDDARAVEAWASPSMGVRAWYDGKDIKARLCKLRLERPRRLWFELTPGAATHAPAITRTIELLGCDPERVRDAALLELPQPRGPGRPPDILMFEVGGALVRWSTIALALSVFFEVERLEYRKERVRTSKLRAFVAFVTRKNHDSASSILWDGK